MYHTVIRDIAICVLAHDVYYSTPTASKGEQANLLNPQFFMHIGISFQSGAQKRSGTETLLTKQRGRSPCELKIGVQNSTGAIRIKHPLTAELPKKP